MVSVCQKLATIQNESAMVRRHVWRSKKKRPPCKRKGDYDGLAALCAEEQFAPRVLPAPARRAVLPYNAAACMIFRDGDRVAATRSGDCLIELEGVSHSYGSGTARRTVLQGVSLSVRKGQSCAIVGRSGSGKSTLLNLIGLLDTPASGTLRIDGQDVRGLSAAQRAVMRNRTIGFVFQGFNLLARLTALDNVALPLLYQGTPRQEARQVARGLLARVGLAERVHHLPADLSGGQRQRVAIARALAANPALLLADEPTGNLDSQNADDILDLLLALNRERGTTLLLITHEERLAARMGRRFHIVDGRVTEEACAPADDARHARTSMAPCPLDAPPPARRYGAGCVQVLREALENLLTLRRRALVALLGIAVGCMAVVTLLNIGHNAHRFALSIFRSMGSDVLVASIQPTPKALNSAQSLLALDVEALRATVPEIREAAPLVPLGTQVRMRGRQVGTTLIGSNEALPALVGMKLQAGRFLSRFDAESTYAVLGANTANALRQNGPPVQPGDAIQVDNYVYSVIGILQPQGHNPLFPVSFNDSILLHIGGMKRLMSAPRIHTILLRSAEPQRLEQTAVKLREALHNSLPGHQADIRIPRQLLDGLAQQTRLFSWLLTTLGGIALVVGGIGVMNVMVMSVAVRRREIGVRMALGARGRDIGTLFLLEAIALAAAGAAIGAVAGLALSWFFVKYSGWVAFSLAPLAFPLGIGSAVLVGLFFGISPALAAARLTPVQALRDA